MCCLCEGEKVYYWILKGSTGTGNLAMAPTLLWRFRGLSRVRQMIKIIFCLVSPVTLSGVNVKSSLERLMVLKRRKGFVDGPTISDNTRQVYLTKDMLDSLLKALEDPFKLERSLFLADITSKKVPQSRYQVFLTFQKRSDTQAAETDVGSTNTDILNRWQLVERAQGKWMVMPMHLHYMQIAQILKPFLHYTWAV
jgi:hypothetical protein